MIDAIKRCISLNMEFAAVFVPDKTCPLLFADICNSADGDSVKTHPVTTAESDWFALKPFSIDNTVKPRLIPAVTEQQLLDLTQNPISPDSCYNKKLFDSTPYAIYQSQVNQIVDSLKKEGGKTVLSRIIDVTSPRSLTDVLDEYFSRFIYTIRFVYSFRDTGLWFGATPELLLDYDFETKELKTMSLAGTRAVTEKNQPWDDKNIDEHRYVTDYILSILKDHNLKTEIYDSTPLQYGSIEHLCDRIRAKGDIDVFSLLDDMSPTPAVCGWPKEKAYNQIISTEIHQRRCYGGWLAFKHGKRISAYVNLRSAQALQLTDGAYRYNLFVGGGITSQSDALSEWEETTAKASTLYQIINR